MMEHQNKKGTLFEKKEHCSKTPKEQKVDGLPNTTRAVEGWEDGRKQVDDMRPFQICNASLSPSALHPSREGREREIVRGGRDGCIQHSRNMGCFSLSPPPLAYTHTHTQTPTLHPPVGVKQPPRSKSRSILATCAASATGRGRDGRMAGNEKEH